MHVLRRRDFYIENWADAARIFNRAALMLGEGNGRNMDGLRAPGRSAPLEAAIKDLIDRREKAEEGSPEYNAAVDEIGKFLDAHPDARLIAEEYNSLLNTLRGTIDS
jgi:hypothetical protein